MHPQDDNALNTEEHIWDLTMQINLKGVWWGCKYAILAMRENPTEESKGLHTGGSIINTASFVAILGAATPQLACSFSQLIRQGMSADVYRSQKTLRPRLGRSFVSLILMHDFATGRSACHDPRTCHCTCKGRHPRQFNLSVSICPQWTVEGLKYFLFFSSGPLKTRKILGLTFPCIHITFLALLMDFLNTEEKRERRLTHVPMGRFGEAVEIAKAALFRMFAAPLSDRGLTG